MQSTSPSEKMGVSQMPAPFVAAASTIRTAAWTIRPRPVEIQMAGMGCSRAVM